MPFVKLAKISDFDGIRIRSYSILGKYVAIVKDQNGSFWATEIGCKHQNADLTTGQFKGDVVRCARHGWVYNIRTGQCLNHPSTPLRRHALRLEGQDVYVSTSPIEPEPPEEDNEQSFEIKFRDNRT